MSSNAMSLSWVKDKEKLSKIAIYFAIVFTLADTLYMNIAGIHYGNKELCIIYNSMPRWLFLIYEYLFELLVIVLLGIFGGVLIEQYINKVKRFFPKNQVLAFLYASFLPICSCGVIPIVETMKERVKLRTLVTFIISAPILNPYIVFMSASVLGWEYALLRIASAFFLAITTGYLVEVVVNFFQLSIPGVYDNCNVGCAPTSKNPYLKTMTYMRRLLPFILLAGALSFAFEFIHPQQYLETLSFNNEAVSMALMTIVGIPVYVCNGADVLFLKPLLSFTDLSMGSAMIFSLTSSAICISSIVMLIKFFGKQVTFTILGVIVSQVLMLGVLINWFI